MDTPRENLLGRTAYDECVQWTCDMFDSAAGKLPATRTGSEYGLATSVAAKALKARLLLYAASPLFNGNTEYYSEFVNTDGSALMPLSYDENKWKRQQTPHLRQSIWQSPTDIIYMKCKKEI